MKIATYNANSVRSRLPGILDWMDRNNPDILCLQETKVRDDEFPVEPFLDKGYQLIFHGQKQYNGVAIISRHPIEEPQIGLPGDPLQEARFISARIGPFLIVNTYIPQGRERASEQFAYKLEWLRLLGRYFKDTLTPEDRLVWTGDMNVAMDNRDVYDPDRLWGHVCFNEEVQRAFGEIMKTGLTDLFRRFHEEGGHYTFWDYMIPNGLKRNMGWRLDYIIADPITAQFCKSCRIDTNARKETKPSDHTYVTAEFDAIPCEGKKRRPREMTPCFFGKNTYILANVLLVREMKTADNYSRTKRVLSRWNREDR